MPDLPAGAELLERAVGYTRTALPHVAHVPPGASTPCTGWDLLTLLRHMDDSLAALTDAADLGYVDLVPASCPPPGDRASLLVHHLQARACALLGAWALQPPGATVSVSGRPLGSRLLGAAGALEIAVHGWDVARTCGVDLPLPPALAGDLLRIVPLLVGPDDRPALFAEPVDVPLAASASTRLLAALGRRG